MSTLSSFRNIENIKNNHDVYRGKDYIKDFYEFLREHAIKIINFQKKKVTLLTKKQNESYKNMKKNLKINS